ncbi:MAG: TIGR03086 family metal-binding protein [Chloroflexi bacterium]|nr:TIGR03086 family metal-binding protein [Chloroflexota bacterium]
MAQGPNPVDLYEAARAQLRPILAASSGKLRSSTPCTEWTVQSLINHAIATQRFTQDVLGPGTPDPSIMGKVDHALPSEGAEAAFNAITDQVLSTLKSINFEDTVETPFGAMPGGQFIMVPITDMIVHSWDLAKATGQNTTLDSGLCELAYSVLANVVPGGRERGAFGPEVIVPATASFQDRMLGLSGRQP